MDEILEYIKKHKKIINVADVLIHFDMTTEELRNIGENAYDAVKEATKQNFYQNCYEYIEQNPDVVFLDDVIAASPVGKSYFYELFPAESQEAVSLKEKLTQNKINKKLALRQKWAESDNATLNLCLYKLLSNEHERRLLADKVETENTNTNFNFAADKDEYTQLCDLINNWKK